MASTTTSSSPTSKFHHHRPTSSSPVRGFLDKLVGRSSGQTPTLPRKLASVPFAASLLCSMTPDEAQKRRLQLQRVANVVVLDATRDKKNNLVIALKVSLKPESPRAQTGIFVPNNAPVAFETARTFENVNQLCELLTFCVDKAADVCGADCEFCTRFREYLQSQWLKEPLVGVTKMGSFVLRKQMMAAQLTQLVAFATRILEAPKETGAAMVPQLSVLGQRKQDKQGSICEAQDEVAAVLFDFFGMFW